VAHPAKDRELVGTLGQLWQVLADLDAVDVRLDRVELATVFGRSVRLEVERVHVRRATRQIDENRIGGLRALKLSRAGHPEIAGQGQAGADRAGLQEVSPSHSVARERISHTSGSFLVGRCFAGGS
jgi:hypothetical protein